MEIRQFRKEQQDYSTAAAAQSGEFRQFRKEQQDYAKAAAAQTTKLVEMMEGLSKRQERLKQQKNNKETLNDQVVQSTETEESDWVKPFFEKRKDWEFNTYSQREKVCNDFFKYVMEKMEEALQRNRLQQRESAGVQKQDEYWPQREALIYLAGGLWRMKFEELGKLHKHYDEKWQAVRDKYESTNWQRHEEEQATLKKQFEERSKDVEYKYWYLQDEIDTAKEHLLKRY